MVFQVILVNDLYTTLGWSNNVKKSLTTRLKFLPKTTMNTWPSCIGLINIKITFNFLITYIYIGLDIDTKYDQYHVYIYISSIKPYIIIRCAILF